MIIKFIEKYGSAGRKDIDNLLMSKLSDVLNEEQKRKKIGNLLFAMSIKEKIIKNEGPTKKPKWILT